MVTDEIKLFGQAKSNFDRAGGLPGPVDGREQ
jgi:hypothetical protein